LIPTAVHYLSFATRETGAPVIRAPAAPEFGASPRGTNPSDRAINDGDGIRARRRKKTLKTKRFYQEFLFLWAHYFLCCRYSCD
jgi:hypothetical protein